MPDTVRPTNLAKIRQVLASLQHLPPTPEVLVRLLKVIDDPDTSLDEISLIVNSDASLSMSLLRLVNSASFGLMRQLTNIRDAVHFLGFSEVKNLSVAVAVKTGLVGNAPTCHTFDRLLLWRHFVGTGVATNCLARRLNHPDANSAFAAGLLHDIGLVVIDQVCPDELAEVKRMVETEGATEEAAEEEIFGFTHGEVGNWLGEQWDIPRSLLFPMLHHHRPWSASRHAGLCALVGIGNHLSMEEKPHIKPLHAPVIDPRTLKMAGSDPRLLDGVRQDLRTNLHRISALLNLT